MHHSSESPRAKDFLGLVHFDLFGPFPVQTPHGKLYAILFLDDHGNNLKVNLLACKDQSLATFQDCHVHWERKFGRKLLAVRCDNAAEFWGDAFNDYIQKHGIERQHSCPYSHQQNGKAERAIRTIEGGVLAMIAAVGAPMNLWGEATLTAAYLWEVTPSRTLPPGVTPFEMSHGRKPDLSHLRVWGSRCFAQVPIELQTKLGPRSRECLFMGYPDGVKGYRVRDLTTGAFFNSRDVIFDENLPSLQLSSDDDDTPPLPEPPPTQMHITSCSPVIVKSLPPTVVRTAPVLKDQASSSLGPRTRRLTEHGVALCDAVQNAKDARARLAAARKARAVRSTCAYVSPATPCPSSPPHPHSPSSPSALPPSSIPAPSTLPSCSDSPSTKGVDHVFWDDHVNLVCSESAFLSLRSDKPRDPSSLSYDLRVPPGTYSEAKRQPDFHVWDEVVHKELSVLRDMGVYSLSQLPPGRKAIGNCWVFEHKIDGDELIPKVVWLLKVFLRSLASTLAVPSPLLPRVHLYEWSWLWLVDPAGFWSVSTPLGPSYGAN